MMVALSSSPFFFSLFFSLLVEFCLLNTGHAAFLVIPRSISSVLPAVHPPLSVTPPLHPVQLSSPYASWSSLFLSAAGADSDSDDQRIRQKDDANLANSILSIEQKKNGTTTIALHDTSIPASSSPTSTTSSASYEFGQVVPLRRRPGSAAADEANASPRNSDTSPAIPTVSADASSSSYSALLQQRQRKNVGVAIASIVLAIANYVWQWTHPVTPIQLLTEMQQQSQPLSVIGRNSLPTVVDFWAPWCENCRLIAPTLHQVEAEYSGRVNFVLVNGDAPEAWPLIEAFGVDAIPHMALVDTNGNVVTALIGPVPKHVLTADLDVLTAKHKPGSLVALPYTMLDVFEQRPEQRHVQFDE